MQTPGEISKLQPVESSQAGTHLDLICDAFVRSWRSGTRPSIEQYLSQAPDEDREIWLLELLREELSLRAQAGETVGIAEYQTRFPADSDTVARAFALTEQNSRHESTVVLDESTFDQVLPHASSATSYRSTDRYRKLQQLGSGSFGTVWLAGDLELQRQVAIKEPRKDRIANGLSIETYLAEARILASLDHPNIVPVYDVGRTETGSCYVVSKWIDGMNLSTYMAQSPLSFEKSAEWIASVADALQQTHHRGLVHRDIKPANILIDGQGRPYVTDFGLALREEDFDKERGMVGTPAYMSPEQARGEGHRVDGRSDLFSLGIVFYEMLTGQRPFVGVDSSEVIRQIATSEAKPPRSLNEKIPAELERICLKALSRRSKDRYATAREMSDDLWYWLEDVRRTSVKSPGLRLETRTSDPSTKTSVCPPEKSWGGDLTHRSDGGIQIVPRGLRSFDQHDADFFLDLLPGPRDRDGLPESVRWWKQRLEETDPTQTFRIGLMYGPSGCGKSSLLKAGIIPRLSGKISCVFVEASTDNTEATLLQGVKRASGGEVSGLKLSAAIASVRRGAGPPEGHKLVLVLDQFEQWLYSHPLDQQTELADALRQCDGERVQAVILVRDDFWMPVTRFLDDQEIRLRQGENAWAVDLLDPAHARNVLTAFGTAYGRLPTRTSDQTSAQRDFLNAAVEDLAEDGRVICVRLALFAEMLKNRKWTPASLRALGGTKGVGTAFLEEMFGHRSASSRYWLIRATHAMFC
jgi:serine/threonine protein kinase